MPLHILIVEVGQQSSSLSNHHQKTPPTVVVLLVDPQMVSEVIDAFGKQCNLNLRRTGVGFMRTELIDNGWCVLHAGLVPLGKRRRGRPSEYKASSSVRCANLPVDTFFDRYRIQLDVRVTTTYSNGRRH